MKFCFTPGLFPFRNNFAKRSGLFSAFVLLSASVFAQTIKGTITSKEGSLPGANVQGLTFSQGTASDLDGTFTIQAPDTGKVKIAISYIGYSTRELELNIVKGVTDLWAI